MSGKSESPVSPHGALSIVLATGFLAEGILRGELVATVTGVSLAALVGAALATVLVSRLGWNRYTATIGTKDPQSPRLIPLGKTPRGRMAALTRVYYRVIFSRQGGTDGYCIRFPLPVPPKDYVPELPGRGVYVADSAQCAISDFAGLFTLRTRMTKDVEGTTIRLVPNPSPVRPLWEPESPAGISGGASSFLRSEELYEVRQFMPGDDPRKINWKVFAHTGTLSVRDGELLPPPASELTVTFWAPLPDRRWPYGSGEHEERELFELLASRAASACLTLIAAGKNLRFPADGNILVRHDDPHARDRVLEALAAPTLEGSRGKPDSPPGQDPASIVCFFLPPRSFTGFSGDFPERNSASKDSLTFFVGPSGKAPLRESLKKRIQGFIFEFPTAEKSFASDPKDIERGVAALERSGFRAYPL